MSRTRAKIPDKGRDRAEVLAALDRFKVDDPDYRRLRTFSLVYWLGEEHTRFLEQAHARFFSANGLNPMAFKSLKRMETEVVDMTAAMLHGDSSVVGTMTAGGTESCMLAVKTYRDLARARRPWLRNPEMVIPRTAHVAWEKGASYFDVKAVHAPLDGDQRLDVRAVRRLVNRRTVMILGSAPEYPHGMVDPIEELSDIALKRNIPLHVDSCVGSFMLPFIEKLGHRVPRWDFRVPGVTSISADVHKYGFGAKGASVVLYRNIDLMAHQMFVYADWPGGLFGSAGMLGTRPGGAVSAAWAALQAIGMDGYLDNARRTMDATRAIADAVHSIGDMRIVGQPHMSLLSFCSTSDGLSIYAVGDQMQARGWHIDRLQMPQALHLMVTPLHADVLDDFVNDLRESVAHVRLHPELARHGGAAMYGMASTIPVRGLVRRSLLAMMKDMYGPDARIPGDGPDDHQKPDTVNRIATRAIDVYSRLRRRFR